MMRGKKRRRETKDKSKEFVTGSDNQERIKRRETKTTRVEKNKKERKEYSLSLSHKIHSFYEDDVYVIRGGGGRRREKKWEEVKTRIRGQRIWIHGFLERHFYFFSCLSTPHEEEGAKRKRRKVSLLLWLILCELNLWKEDKLYFLAIDNQDLLLTWCRRLSDGRKKVLFWYFLDFSDHRKKCYSGDGMSWNEPLDIKESEKSFMRWHHVAIMIVVHHNMISPLSLFLHQNSNWTSL